jgi:tetratricopeptide (TPR) repeat protein
MNSASGCKLSICMIVKDEALNLPRCLDSIAPVADEIVVVDTGSSDQTVDIATAKGCRVISWAWQNDFAAARNVSIRAATGTWILWLDADDIVPPESLPLLHQLKQEQPNHVCNLIVRNQKPGNTGSEFLQARMFPNRDDIFFEGRIHEQMMPSALRIGLPLIEKPIVIEHHGYADPVQMRIKARRNIQLLLAGLDTSSPEPVTVIEIADSYTILEEWDAAQSWYEKLSALPGVERFPVLASQAHLGLGTIFNRRDEHSRAVEHFSEAHRLCPGRVDVLYGLAVALEMAGDPDAAMRALCDIFSVRHRPIQVGVDYRQTVVKANLRLARLYWEAGRRLELDALVNRALQTLSDRPEIRNMAGAAWLQLGRVMDALHCFEKSLAIAIEGNIDAYIGLCMIYRKAGRVELVQNTLAQVGQLFVHSSRYWAALKMMGAENLPPVMPPDINPESLAKEETYLRRMFGSV